MSGRTVVIGILGLIAVVYLAETRFLRGTQIARNPNGAAEGTTVVPFVVTAPGKYSMVVETVDRNGASISLALQWQLTSNWGVVFDKNREKVPRSNTRYIRFEPEEKGSYLLEITPVSGLAAISGGAQSARISVTAFRGDRRMITPWLYWMGVL